MMRPFRTLRVRLALWIAGWLLLMLAAFGAFVYINLQQGLLAAVDNSLALSASQAAAAVNIENNRINFQDSIPEGALAASLPANGFTIRIIDLAGTVRQSVGPYQSLPVDAGSLAAAQQLRSVYTTIRSP